MNGRFPRWTRSGLEVDIPQLLGDKGSCMQDPSWAHLVYFFICLFMFYNKPININKVFSWVLWIILANYQIWGEYGESKKFFHQLDRSVDGLGTPFVAGIWSRGSLVGSTGNSKYVLTELS